MDRIRFFLYFSVLCSNKNTTLEVSFDKDKSSALDAAIKFFLSMLQSDNLISLCFKLRFHGSILSSESFKVLGCAWRSYRTIAGSRPTRVKVFIALRKYFVCISQSTRCKICIILLYEGRLMIKFRLLITRSIFVTST